MGIHLATAGNNEGVGGHLPHTMQGCGTLPVLPLLQRPIWRGIQSPSRIFTTARCAVSFARRSRRTLISKTAFFFHAFRA
jgi:hypothetical protein